MGERRTRMESGEGREGPPTPDELVRLVETRSNAPSGADPLEGGLFHIAHLHPSFVPAALSMPVFRSQVGDIKRMHGKQLTPLAVFLRNGHDRPDTVQEFIAAGAPLTVTDNLGMTPLHYAADAGAHESARLLLKQPDVKEEVDRVGTTPLDLAVKYHHHETMAVLDSMSLNLARMCRAAFLRQHGKRVPYVLRDLRDFPQFLKLFLNYGLPYPGFSLHLMPSPQYDTQAELFNAVGALQHMLSVASDEFLQTHGLSFLLCEDVQRPHMRERMRQLYIELFETNDFRMEPAQSSRAATFNCEVEAMHRPSITDAGLPGASSVVTAVHTFEWAPQSREMEHSQSPSAPDPTARLDESTLPTSSSLSQPLPFLPRPGLLLTSLRSPAPHACTQCYPLDTLPPLEWTSQDSEAVERTRNIAWLDTLHVRVPIGHALLVDFGPYAKVTAESMCMFVAAPDGEELHFVVESSVVPHQGAALTGVSRHERSRICWRPLVRMGVNTDGDVVVHPDEDTVAPPYSFPREQRMRWFRALGTLAEDLETEDSNEMSQEEKGEETADKSESAEDDGCDGDKRGANEGGSSGDGDLGRWTCVASSMGRPVKGARLFRIRPTAPASSLLVRQMEIYGSLAYPSLFFANHNWNEMM